MGKITTGSDELIEIIKTNIGIEEFDKLIAGTKNHGFTSLLVDAALEDKPAALIKKVILMRKLIAAIQTLVGGESG